MESWIQFGRVVSQCIWWSLASTVCHSRLPDSVFWLSQKVLVESWLQFGSASLSQRVSVHLVLPGLSCLSVTAGGGRLSCNFASDRLTLLYYLPVVTGCGKDQARRIVLYRTLLYYLLVVTVCDQDQARCSALYRTRYIWPLVPFLPSRL